MKLRALLPLRVLRVLTVINALALAALVAAVLVFGREWPQALRHVFDALPGIAP